MLGWIITSMLLQFGFAFRLATKGFLLKSLFSKILCITQYFVHPFDNTHHDFIAFQILILFTIDIIHMLLLDPFISVVFSQNSELLNMFNQSDFLFKFAKGLGLGAGLRVK